MIRPAALVGAAGAAYERLRVAASADGKRGPWAEAAIAAAAAGKLTVELTVPDDLHAYGGAAAVRATVTEADGSAAVDAAARLTLSVEGLRDGSWYALDGGLVDADTWQPLGLDRGWTDNEWCLDALLAEAVPHTAARVRIWQDGMLRASAEIALRRDLAVTVTAPASAVVDREFALQMAVTDGSGGALPRFDAAAAAAALRVSVSYEDAPEGGAMLYDAASEAAPAWYSGWDEGAWGQSRAAVDAPCTCTVAVLSRADSTVLGTAEIAVLSEIEALLEAIRERQRVTGRTVWAEGIEKTLEQCITEVNALAPSFVAGTYAGGADVPERQPNTYGSDAADEAALYALVCALRKTVGSASVVNGETWSGWSTGQLTRAAAIAAAEAKATAAVPSTIRAGAGVGYTDSYDYFEAAYRGIRWEYLVTGLSDQIGVGVEWYAKAAVFAVLMPGPTYGVTTSNTYTYGNLGLSGAPSGADVYQSVASATSSGVTSATSGVRGAATNAWRPPSWPARGETGGVAAVGFEITNILAVLTWGFEHV